MIHGIFIGLSTIDLLYTVDHFPIPNSKIAAQSLEVITGGPATNAAIAFHHLGGSATLATATGRHVLATVIRKELEARAINLIDLAPNSEELPVIASIAVNHAGERNVISPYTGRTTITTEPPESALKQAQVLLTDGHAIAAAQTWTNAARRHNIPVVLDGGSWKPGTKELLSHIDYAICSADFHPPDCATQQDIIAFLKTCNVPNIAITNGADPILYATVTTTGTVPVPAAEILDTTGAGDVFHGAFAYYIATGLLFERALAEAASVATHSCRFRGTREWMQAQHNI